MGDPDMSKRAAHSERILSRVNDELAQYRSSNGIGVRDKTYSVHSFGTRQRYVILLYAYLALGPG